MIPSPALIMAGVNQRIRAVRDHGGGIGRSMKLEDLYEMISDIMRKTAEDEATRLRAASDVATAIFKQARGDVDKITEMGKAIEVIKVPSNTYEAHAELIPKDSFWSSNQGRALTREQVLNWATAPYDTTEGDRFWVGPRACVSIAKVPTATGMAWMLTTYSGDSIISSAQLTDAFALMIYFDRWAFDLRTRHGLC